MAERSGTPGGADVSIFYRERRRPRTQEGLNRDRVVAAAVALLDREGADALTMRRLAAELGVHATSLYWYVDRREDLVDLALDAIFADAASEPEPELEGSRLEGVRAAATAMYRSLTAHPWAAAFAGSRPLVGPNALELVRRVLRGLEATGASEEERAVAATAVSNLVLGAAISAAAARALGLDRDTTLARQVVSAVTGAGAPEPGRVEWLAHFDAGLDLVLRGVELRHAR